MVRIYLNMLVLICFCFISCQRTLEYDELAEVEIFKFASQVKQTNGFRLIGFGGEFQEKINSMMLTFESDKSPDIDEARSMFFDIATRFVDHVNQSEALRPYLANHPFDIVKNLELSLLFFDSDSITSIGMGPMYMNRKWPYVFFGGYDCTTQKIGIVHQEAYKKSFNLYERQKVLDWLERVEKVDVSEGL